MSKFLAGLKEHLESEHLMLRKLNDAVLNGNVNAQLTDGQTFLHIAVKEGNIEVLMMLILRGADLEITENSFGWTPLHWAVVYGNLESVQLLVLAGSNLQAQDDRGKTPLDWAKDDKEQWIRDHLTRLEKNGLQQTVTEVTGNKPLPSRPRKRLSE